MTRAKFNTKKTFQDSKPRAGGEDNKKLEDLVDTVKLPEKEYVAMRLVGPAIPYAQHWIEFHSTKKDKDVNIPKICLAFDPETEDFDSSKKCPYCDAGNKASVAYLTNAIIRDLQENEPAKKGKMTDNEKKTGFKEKSSKTWTPVRVVRITSTVASKFQNLSNANKVKDKKTGETVAKPLSDEKYGRDIQMLYDSKAAGAAKYDVQKGDERTPLTEEESEYLLWNIEGLFEPEDLSRAKQEAAKFFGKGGKKGDDADYDEDDDMPKSKKGKKGKKEEEDDDYLDSDEDEAPKSKKKGKKKPADSDEDDPDSDEDAGDSDDDADSDDDEPKSKKGKKGKPGLKAKDSDDDGFSDDDEDDDAEDDEDEDDEPKSKKKSKGKKKPADSDDDEDDDSDSDDDDSDSDDDEPKSKKKGKKKPADSDEDDDSDDDEDDDEPKSKKGKGKEKAKAKGKKKPADSDEDDVDLDDLDEDEDEEEEAPKSKKKGKDKKSKKKGKKDEDSDDDIPF